MATYIGEKGYSILKNCLDIKEQEMIRKDLIVTPFVPKSSMAKPHPFPIYRESHRKFYIPRFYGIKTYGTPEQIRINKGHSINLSFQGNLRKHQVLAVKKFFKMRPY